MNPVSRIEPDVIELETNESASASSYGDETPSSIETIDATQCREYLSPILDAVVRGNKRFIVTTDDGNALIISEETWNSIVETLYVLSEPEMMHSIEECESEYPDGCMEWKEWLETTRTNREGTDPPNPRSRPSLV